jgi:hypothetical protein
MKNLVSYKIFHGCKGVSPLRRDGRVDEGARLEIAYSERNRGFKSLSLRPALQGWIDYIDKKKDYSDTHIREVDIKSLCGDSQSGVFRFRHFTQMKKKRNA